MKYDFQICFKGIQYEIPYEAEFISKICSYLPENSSPELLIAFAAHSSTAVQCALASRIDLPLAALETLIDRGNKQVRRTLVFCEHFKAWATAELIIEWAADDAEFAAAAASQIMEFENADTNALFTVLSSHEDPDVRRELAQAWGLPKLMRQKLAHDIDFGVARAASKN